MSNFLLKDITQQCKITIIHRLNLILMYYNRHIVINTVFKLPNNFH